MKFKDKLKELRNERGISQKEIAKELNVSITGYAGWEQGYREPDLETVKILAEYFQVTTDELLGTDIVCDSGRMKHQSTNKAQIYTMSPLDRTFKGTIVEQLNDEELGRIKESVIILANGIKSNRTLRRQEQEAAKLTHKSEK